LIEASQLDGFSHTDSLSKSHAFVKGHHSGTGSVLWSCTLELLLPGFPVYIGQGKVNRFNHSSRYTHLNQVNDIIADSLLYQAKQVWNSYSSIRLIVGLQAFHYDSNPFVANILLKG
jgi:hypothetical protein